MSLIVQSGLVTLANLIDRSLAVIIAIVVFLVEVLAPIFVGLIILAIIVGVGLWIYSRIKQRLQTTDICYTIFKSLIVMTNTMRYCLYLIYLPARDWYFSAGERFEYLLID